MRSAQRLQPLAIPQFAAEPIIEKKYCVTKYRPEMKNSFLIRVYGDSLSLPRTADGIGYGDIYPELLRDSIEERQSETRVVVFNRSRGGASISELHRQYVDDSAYFPLNDSGILIIQCGIVDCAPRPVPASVRVRIGRLPKLLRWAAVKLLHFLRPYLLRAGIAWAITPAEHFEQTLTQWLQEAQLGLERIYVINIAPTVSEIETHSPGLSRNIHEYNTVIRRAIKKMNSEVVTLLDAYKTIKAKGEDLTQYINAHDGHHITRSAHQLYADLLFAEEVRREYRKSQ